MYRVETIVTKGEIAHDEQFFLLSQCFQKLSAAEAFESVCMCTGKGLMSETKLNFYYIINPWYKNSILHTTLDWFMYTF